MDETLGSLRSKVDLILIFAPAGTVLAGTNDWKACAYVKNLLSAHNDYCTSFPGTIMHEIGHDIGLLQLHELSYGDAFEAKIDGPHVCFHSAKSW